MTHTRTRSGFSLIELLTVIAIITLLSTLGILVFPGIRDQNKVQETAARVGGALKVAQGSAARDKAARGVRFVVQADPTNPAKTDAAFVTELQYIELPPPLVPNPKPLSPSAQNPSANPIFEPRIRFQYNTDATGTIVSPNPSASPAPPARRCFVENLTSTQADKVQGGCTLVMSVFGTWHRIISVGNKANAASGGTAAATGAEQLYDKELFLEVFPDATMGGATHNAIYHFAVYLPAVPLIGEKPVLLPTDVCVDLNLSVGPTQPINTDFDVVFGPDGKLVGAPNGQLFLWVRNYTKPAIYTINPGPPQTVQLLAGGANGGPLVDAFRRGGDQYVLSVRNTGAHGHAPALWPNAATGNYTAGQTPYTLARQELQQE